MRAPRYLSRLSYGISLGALTLTAGLAAQQPPASPAAPQAQPSSNSGASAPPAAPSAPVSAENATSVDAEFSFAPALSGPGETFTAAQLAKRAVQTAPAVARARAAGVRAEAAAGQVNTALYPRLELEARYTRLSEIDLPPQFQGAIPLIYDNYLLQARVSYPVSSLFFSILPRYKAAQRSAESQKLQETVEAQNVALQTQVALYNYARSRAHLLVVEAALAQSEAHRRDVDALVRAGTLARVELMRAEAEMAQAKVNVTRATGNVAVTRVQLYALAHIEGTADITIAEDLERPLPPLTENEDALLARALERRTEIKALRTVATAHEHNIDALQGEQLPVLVVGGSADYSNPNSRYFGSGDEWNGSWAAFASLTWSPNDWASSGRSVDQARADLAVTLADLESLEDMLRVEVSQAYDDYNSAAASLEAARAGIVAAEESYRVRREQFRAGAAVAIDVIDAEAQLRDARLGIVNAIIDMRVARARLDRAVESQ